MTSLRDVGPPWCVADVGARGTAVLELPLDGSADDGAVAALEVLVPWLAAHPRPPLDEVPEEMRDDWAWHSSALSALMPALGDADPAVVALYLEGRQWDPALAPAVTELFEWGAAYLAARNAAGWLVRSGRTSPRLRGLLDEHELRLEYSLAQALRDAAGAG